MFRLSVVGTLALCVCVATAGAQEQQLDNRPIKGIEIQGLKGVSEQLVRSQIEVQVGQTYNPAAIARDIRRLHSLGNFDTIKVDAKPEGDGLILTYLFEEKRVIDAIKIIGNDKIRASKIRGVLSWKEGDAFAPDAYDEERKAIVKMYEEKGFANTSVDINVEEVGPSRVRVTYVVNEGKKARIRSIVFEGNERLSDHQLRKAMKTKPAWWFLRGKYNEQKFETDLNTLVDKYGDVGHLEASVSGTDIEYSPNGKKMDVKISVAEGPEYKVDTIETAHNVVFDDDEILDLAKVHAGDIHNKGQVAKDAESVAKKYSDSGYVNAEVTPQVTLDREKKTTHVVENVKEGDLKYIKEIDVTGNTVTKDEVIRRDMLISPGDRFDGSAVRSSQQRLENTRYFEATRLTLHDLTDDDLYTSLMVDVDEGKTGNFNFGAGYSSEEQIGGFVELRLNNFDITNWPKFSGGGQIFSTRLNVGTIRQQYNISFTDPEIFGYPIAFGVDLFDDSYRYRRRANYTEEVRGGQLRLAKSLSPYVTVRTALRYTEFEYRDLENEELYTPEWRRNFDPNNTISTSWSIERNTLDLYRDPSKGSKHELIGTFAGFGGDNNFYRLEHDSTWYFPLKEDKTWVLSFRARQGYVDEYGSSDFVPFSERFFAGGTYTVRGYDIREIGPRIRAYINSNDLVSVGGKLRLVNNLEVKYKVAKALRLYWFMDSGAVWEEAGDFNLGDIKYSTGLGFGVEIPMLGPIRVDYGYPLNPSDYQNSSGRLHLMTGFRF